MTAGKAVPIVVLVLAVVLAVMVWAGFAAAWVHRTRSTKRDTSTADAAPRRRWTIVGTGVAACATASYLPSSVRAAVRFRDASAGIGGRVLTGAKALVQCSPQTPAVELGAFVVDTYLHHSAMHWLRQLGIPVTTLVRTLSTSMVYVDGVRSGWPGTPNFPPASSAERLSLADWTAVVGRRNVLAWTGLDPDVLPDASVAAVGKLITPVHCTLPGALGWTAAITAALQTLPFQGSRSLAAIDATPTSVALTYLDGEMEVVDGAVVTVPARTLANVPGILPRVKLLLGPAGTVQVPLGVLVLQWAPAVGGAWWAQAGLGTDGMLATDTDLGCVVPAGPGMLRCLVAGQERVQRWTATMAVPGNDTQSAGVAAVDVAGSLLQQALGLDAPPPRASFATFRPWLAGLVLWRHDLPAASQADAAAIVRRPCGSHVPVWYASSDASTWQGMVEGAVASGRAVAAQCAAWVSTERPSHDPAAADG